MKRILIDVGHPAHVHYYKNLAKVLESKGYEIYWTVKDIKIAKSLLTNYGFPYTTLPQKSDTLIGKTIKQLYFDFVLLRLSIKYKIDYAIGTSVGVVHLSKITKIKSFIFDDDDDDVQPLFTKYVIPYADVLLSPDSLRGKRKRSDTIYYPGYHELAYLHPKRFKPDPYVLDQIGLAKDEPFFLMRFNAFKAHHDIGETGLTIEQKLKLIRILKLHGRVLITTERQIEPELMKYQLKISPDKIHSLMAYSAMFIGDSQTMTSESAMLGIPSLRCNTFAGRISYLEELEHKYHLTYGFSPDHFNLMEEKLHELLAIPDLKALFKSRQKIMLKEKIDVTSYWVWFLEHYPESYSQSRENPDQLLQFI